MQLWPAGFESLRAEARDAVAAGMPFLRELLGLDDHPSGDASERARRLRAGFAALNSPVPEAADVVLAGVRCRVLRPDTALPRAVYLHFHGGGMIVGAPEMSDGANRDLSRALGVAVVSVDYRLAPEHPHPAAVDDGVAVAAWLADHAAAEFGTSRLLIGGESAGTHVAAASLLRLRDELDAAGLVAGADLAYGIHDWGRSPSQRGIRPSGVPDLLDPDGIAFSADCYLPGLTDDARRHPAISPAFADLRGLPPVFLSVGTADHLVDDTLLLAGRWAAAGNEVELFVAPDMPHAFPAFPCALTSRWRAARHAWLARSCAA